MEVRRTIAAPRERVFRAWTTATSVQHWFSTPQARVRSVKLEPRVGGAIRIDCEHGGGTWQLDGRFTVFEQPGRIAFSWITSDVPAEAGSTVTVEFHERGAATEIVITQVGFPAEAKRRDNESGWTELAGHLADLMAAQPTLRSVARRVIPAPPEAVWRAWTTPELMVHFLSPVAEGARARADVRVGGRFSILMADDKGRLMPHQGEYFEVDPPRRLRFSWLSDWSPADLHPMVTVTLRPVAGGTEVELIHQSQLDEPTRADHEAGWAEFLDLLIVLAGAGFATGRVVKPGP